MLLIVFVVSFLSLVHSQVITIGTCPTDIIVQANFNISKYLGRWYNIQYFPSVYETGICTQDVYTTLSNGNVNVTKVMQSREDPNLIETIEGEAFKSAGSVTPTDGKFRITLFADEGMAVVTGDYWVLSTDYKHYAVVWSCKDIASNDGSLAVNSQYLWVLSRERELNSNASEVINQVLRENNISTLYLSSVENQNCDSAVFIAPQFLTLLLSLIFIAY